MANLSLKKFKLKFKYKIKIKFESIKYRFLI